MSKTHTFFDLASIASFEVFARSQATRIDKTSPEWYQYLGAFINQIYYLLITNKSNIECLHQTGKLPESLCIHSELKFIDDYEYFLVCFINPIQRYFCSQIHAVVEEAVKKYIDEKCIAVPSARHTCQPLVCCREKDKPINLVGYINLIFKQKGIKKPEKSAWNKFFEALTIVRNRGAHSNKKLIEHEKKVIIGAHLGDLLNENDKIAIEISHFQSIIGRILEFYQLYLN